MRKILLTSALAFSIGAPLLADSALPSGGFSGDRYTVLWTKSPFAIATAEAAPESADYQLVGLAQFDGISYANLVVKQTQEHFVLSSQKSEKNLTLVSIRHDVQGGSAVIQRNGERLVLQETIASATAPPADMNAAVPTPGAVPGMSINPSVGGIISPANSYPPHVRIHRPVIVIPPRPPNQ